MYVIDRSMMSTSDITATTTTTSHDPPPPPPADHQTSTDQEPDHVNVEEYLDSFPIGYRFIPTDKELLHYLSLRYHKQNLPPNRINEVNLYDHHPEYLTSPGRFKAYENDQEWYFFTPRDRKYPNGDRPKRSAGGKGYWKATGVDKKIFKEEDPTTGGGVVVDKKILIREDEPNPTTGDGGVVVDKKNKKKILREEDEDEVEKEKLGSKKTLVYYEGKPPHGIKTNWVMHEFKLDETLIQKNSRADMLLNETVLCRIHIKKTKSSDNSTTSSGSRKKKLVHHADHSLSSPTEEGEEEEEEEEEDPQEEALSVRGREIDVYNDMEDEQLLICSNYDSIMQQYSPTNLHQILNNVDSSYRNSTTAASSSSSSNIMGATSSTAVPGAASSNIMPLQTCPPTSWVTAPVRNEYCYMDTSTGIVARDMVSMLATHNSTYSNINIRQGVDDQIQQWDAWMNSLSSCLPAGHPRVSSLSSFVPAGHPPPPPPQILKVPQGCSQLPPLSQMPTQMQQQAGYQYHHQYSSSSSWADHGNNNIDGSSISSSSGINYKLHDHAIRREPDHMASKENDNNATTTEHSEYLNDEENLEGFDQTPFSKAFNGTSFPDCGRSRR